MRSGSQPPARPERLLRHRLGPVPDLGRAYRLLVGDGDGFWLHSGTPDPARPGRARHYLGPGAPVELGAPVLETLRVELDRPAPELDPDADPGAPEFRLGLVGWFEYELYGETLGLPVSTDRSPARLLRADRALVVDADTAEAELIAVGAAWEGELAQWRDQSAAALAAEAESASIPPLDLAGEVPGTTVGVPIAVDDASYLAQIRACQQAIVDGDSYLLCLTTRIELPGIHPDPVTLFEALARQSPAHHAGLIRIGDTALVSSSPERFLAVDRERRVSTSPIKGTRPRGADAAADDALRAELLVSEKERAENLMIVDLMRNDLARVCEVGSVEVTRFLSVESYAQVHQLVSTVEGRLAPGRSIVDVLEAAFPAGSMTGTPKRRAVELLAGIETAPRGVYAGAFGWIGWDGAAELAMVIRSIVLDPSGASIGTGGGITALSVPEEELAEMRLKAAALLAVLGVDS